jgi:hypothetical protein
LTEDNTYNGYFMPAGSLTLANIWYAQTSCSPLSSLSLTRIWQSRAIQHDPATYPEPLKFRPERFLTSAPLSDFTFGFGRRICPGRFFARDMMWSAMTNMLATFEFLPATDTEGRPAPPAQEFSPFFAS